ncbi:hypothetical protein DW083_19100 [Parabacteroides sp. AF48-14]|uniref:hypothetical protein n=1 Tax=Parabacteroides sp. AF48-14 TaxID=2292052 RepID=UPI000EFE6CF0|nr:hypothetical protein [Parabacteroides sp. AF48-14]RHO66365.1 hypothetical protein DW083_19100 [Parabacteroides sp. AF48-14]
MKKTKHILVCTLIICTAIYWGFYFMPVRFYLMPIDAWERKIWMGPSSTQKEENYVVYNHLCKNERTLIDSIIAFNDRTIRLDSIKKYPDGYRRSFFRRSIILNKDYREEANGSDIIYDHFDKRILLFEWRIINDTVYVEFFDKRCKVPLTGVDKDAISISKLSGLIKKE